MYAIGNKLTFEVKNSFNSSLTWNLEAAKLSEGWIALTRVLVKIREIPEADKNRYFLIFKYRGVYDVVKLEELEEIRFSDTSSVGLYKIHYLNVQSIEFGTPVAVSAEVLDSPAESPGIFSLEYLEQIV